MSLKKFSLKSDIISQLTHCQTTKLKKQKYELEKNYPLLFKVSYFTVRIHDKDKLKLNNYGNICITCALDILELFSKNKDSSLYAKQLVYKLYGYFNSKCDGCLGIDTICGSYTMREHIASIYDHERHNIVIVDKYKKFIEYEDYIINILKSFSKNLIEKSSIIKDYRFKKIIINKNDDWVTELGYVLLADNPSITWNVPR